MEITIKHLGAVKSANIDLSKKLNIFCGPNSTGKTYLAYLLYSITNIENKSLGIKLDNNLLFEMAEKDCIEIEVDYNHLWDFKEKEVKNIRENISSLFAVSENKADKFFKATLINFYENKDEFISRVNNIDIDVEINLFGFLFNVRKLQKTNSIVLTQEKNVIKDELYLKALEIGILSRIYSLIVFYPIISSTILPVERNSIYTFSDELSITNLERIDMIKELSANKKDINPFEVLFKRSTRYPQPIRDGLKVAENLKEISKKKSPYFEFATELELELLNGKVIITNEGNVEFASNRAKSVKLSFHQSSSIVKTMSSLIIYLKHLATPNDLVIIDEPELNLHPDNQVKLTKIISRLINKGLRFIVSTHSDYMIREFNNLIMVSNYIGLTQNNELLNKLNYNNDEYLNNDDVEVHYFRYLTKTAKQATVTKVDIDKFGFEVETLDQTINDLNNKTEELYYSINNLLYDSKN